MASSIARVAEGDLGSVSHRSSLFHAILAPDGTLRQDLTVVPATCYRFLCGNVRVELLSYILKIAFPRPTYVRRLEGILAFEI